MNDIRVPSIYRKSAQKQIWYRQGYEDAQAGKVINQEAGTTGAYQHGYRDGLKQLEKDRKPGPKEIAEALQAVEELVQESDPDGWPGWVVRMLQAMDRHVDDKDELVRQLRGIQTRIEARIGTGKW